MGFFVEKNALFVDVIESFLELLAKRVAASKSGELGCVGAVEEIGEGAREDGKPDG
ncbi:MAG: hypothetical protein KIT27_02015 [Legionellales bacterium]|nr:hypothetical protein [Legionellales bacterium]